MKSFLEKPPFDRPALALTLGAVTFAPVAKREEPSLAEMAERLAALEREVAMLRSFVTHSGTLAKRVVEMVNKWEGPFTAPQIREAVYARWPEARPAAEHQQVNCKLTKMAAQGLIAVIEPGRGPQAAIYERVGHPPAEAGRRGQKPGRRHRWQSGIILAARAALEAMPAEFTTADLKCWVREHQPALAGSDQWGAVVNHLRQGGELVTVRRFNQRGWKCLFKRGRVITSTGTTLKGKEAAWRELRAGIKTEMPELLGTLERK